MRQFLEAIALHHSNEEVLKHTQTDKSLQIGERLENVDHAKLQFPTGELDIIVPHGESPAVLEARFFGSSNQLGPFFRTLQSIPDKRAAGQPMDVLQQLLHSEKLEEGLERQHPAGGQLKARIHPLTPEEREQAVKSYPALQSEAEDLRKIVCRYEIPQKALASHMEGILQAEKQKRAGPELLTPEIRDRLFRQVTRTMGQPPAEGP